MPVTLIAAVSKNGIIGAKNELPWYIPDDLKHFKALTTGKVVLMGRKTFESILKRLGKPLPNRKNAVVTRDQNYSVLEGVIVFHTVDEALEALKGEEVMVAGGGEIFAQTIDRAGKLYITEVDKEIEGDTYFPKINPATWKEIARENHAGFSFVTYTRK